MLLCVSLYEEYKGFHALRLRRGVFLGVQQWRISIQAWYKVVDTFECFGSFPASRLRFSIALGFRFEI